MLVLVLKIWMPEEITREGHQARCNSLLLHTTVVYHFAYTVTRIV